jgi:hypothetical protein
VSGGFDHRAEKNCLVAIVGIAAALALPRLLDARREAALFRLVDACHVAPTASGTGASDTGASGTAAVSTAFVGFKNGLRLEGGRLVVDGAPYGDEHPATRIDASTTLERGPQGLWIVQRPTPTKAVLLALVAFAVAGISGRWATVSSRGRAAAKRALLVLAVVALNPCLLFPLHAAGAGEVIAIKDGQVTRTRRWFGVDFTPVAAGRLRAVGTWSQGCQVWAVLEKDGVLQPELLGSLDAPDPRLDATLLEAAAH